MPHINELNVEQTFKKQIAEDTLKDNSLGLMQTKILFGMRVNLIQIK